MSLSQLALEAGFVARFFGFVLRKWSWAALFQAGKLRLWPEQSALDLRLLWSTRSSMEMEALCTVQCSLFGPFELAKVDAILFPKDAHSFVRDGGRSVLE